MPAWIEAKRIGSIAAHPFDSAQGRLLQKTQGWGTHVLISEKKTDCEQEWGTRPTRLCNQATNRGMRVILRIHDLYEHWRRALSCCNSVAVIPCHYRMRAHSQVLSHGGNPAAEHC